MKPSLLSLMTCVVGATLVHDAATQRRVASYEFSDESIASSHSTANTASDLTISNSFLFDAQRNWLFLTTDWNGTGGSITFTVTPEPGRPMSFTSLHWDAVTAAAYLSDSVRSAQVFADGVEVARFSRLRHNTTYSADLTTVPSLLNTTQPVDFEIRFDGNPLGLSSYAIDSIGVEAAECVQNLPGEERIVWLPINGARGDDRLFRALDGFSFRERPDGTALLTGAIVNVNDPDLRFSVEVTLSGRINAGEPPPSGSPRIEPAIEPFLVQNGGTIDPAAWRYYRSIDGVLRGRRTFEGAELQIRRRGEAFQIGEAANLKTPALGGSAWFDVHVRRQPSKRGVSISCHEGDFNFELDASCSAFVTTTATSSSYGSGIAGCDGVPSLQFLDDPLLGTSPRLLTGTKNRSTRNAAQIWSVTTANIPVPVLGGELLVGMPFAAVVPFVVQPGGTEFSVEILEDPRQDGLSIALQIFSIDPCGPAGLAATRGLLATLGGL